jgi:hypothetical protein
VAIVFYHPDYTVGAGIKPALSLSRLAG